MHSQCVHFSCTFFRARCADATSNLEPATKRGTRPEASEKTERVHADGAMPAAAAVVLHEDGQEDKKRADVCTRVDEISAPLAAGLASADKMRRWADGRATEGAIIAPRCGLLP